MSPGALRKGAASSATTQCGVPSARCEVPLIQLPNVGG